jgi:hypothetical protein
MQLAGKTFEVGASWKRYCQLAIAWT